jgi:hypothetical protein
MKHLLTLFAICFVIISYSQQTNETKPQQSMVVAFNSEQIIEKMGFEHLMKVVFEKKRKDYISENEIAEKATVRKALAALYGAGVDFKRKTWFTVEMPIYQMENPSSFQSPKPYLIIPVANREVFKKGIIDMFSISNSYKNENDKANTFIEKGNISYMMVDDNIILILTDKDFIFTTIPYNYNFYDNNFYQGKTIKTDTVKIPLEQRNSFIFKSPNNVIVEENKTNNTTNTDVDKYSNGKIIRLYKPKVEPKLNGTKYKMSKEKYESVTSATEAVKMMPEPPPPPPPTDLPILTYDQVSPAIAVDTAASFKAKTTKTTKNTKTKKVEIIKYTRPKLVENEKSIVYEKNEAVVGAVTEDMVAPRAITEAVKEVRVSEEAIYNTKAYIDRRGKDTLTRTEYVNDSIQLKITYIEYSQQEMDSLQKIRTENEKIKKEADIQNILATISTKLPYTVDNADMTKIKDSKMDVAMLTSVNGLSSAYLGGITSMLSNTMFNNSMGATSLAFYNFENGKLVAKMQGSCCNKANDFYTNMYYPVTNFFPKELEKGNLGAMRMHFNVPQLLEYYKQMMPREINLEEKMKEEGFVYKDIAEIFEGEVTITIGVTTNEKYGELRTMPKAIFALKIKNAEKAVAFMNKINAKDLSAARYYKFDENGQYLLFNTEKNDILNVVKTAQPYISTLSEGNFGEMNFNIKEMIKQYAMSDFKTSKMNTILQNFFGKITMVNNKTEEGNFIADMELDLGDKNTNALYNLVELGNNIADAEQERRLERDKKWAAEDKAREQFRKEFNKKTATKKVVKKKK